MNKYGLFTLPVCDLQMSGGQSLRSGLIFWKQFQFQAASRTWVSTVVTIHYIKRYPVQRNSQTFSRKCSSSLFLYLFPEIEWNGTKAFIKMLEKISWTYYRVEYRDLLGMQQLLNSQDLIAPDRSIAAYVCSSRTQDLTISRLKPASATQQDPGSKTEAHTYVRAHTLTDTHTHSYTMKKGSSQNL